MNTFWRRRAEEHAAEVAPRPASNPSLKSTQFFWGIDFDPVYNQEILKATSKGSPWRFSRDDLIRISTHRKCLGSMNITTHLDHVSYCKTASGTNWLNRWTCLLCLINTRRDCTPSPEARSRTSRLSGAPYRGTSLKRKRHHP